MTPTKNRLMEISYNDPGLGIRLTAYADTVIIDHADRPTLCAIRFGGYPEMVRALSDAIYGGSTVELRQGDADRFLECRPKGYRRVLSHDGLYAAATLMADDDSQTEEHRESDADNGGDVTARPRKSYIFCPQGDRKSLFDELDRKTAAPMIPAFQDYLLDALIAAGDLRQMTVLSSAEHMDAWALKLLPEDRNVTDILERGLRDGHISILGTAPDTADSFAEVNSVTDYLNTYGVTVADRIRDQFVPRFDPASEPLSEEILSINRYIQEKVGYSLYDAQLAVTEAVKRQLVQRKMALIVAECGSGKTKLSAAAMGALCALNGQGHQKAFHLVMCPSHVTKKWVREISETLPDTYGMVVKSITDLDRLYALYEQGDKSVYAVFSKERARDGYMHYPAVLWSRRKRGFVCPDCLELIEMETSSDGTRYMVPSDQFFFQREHRANHKCPHCGTPLWAPVNERRQTPWIKLGDYGWVYRPQIAYHLSRTRSEPLLERLRQIMEQPELPVPTRGAHRRFPLSTYIKKKYRGRISGFLCDELHEYSKNSGQGDAMAELYSTCRKFIGMTATLINGYSSGIFHLLYRIVPSLMLKDGKPYSAPSRFDAEYGVVENTYEITDADYNSNRRSVKQKKRSRQLPGVSPLVFSRFLLECTAFLSLSDMGKDLPDYEEIPVPLTMPEKVADAYHNAESALTSVLRSDRKAAGRILSAYLNLLTVYPNQPYGQPEIVHPLTGLPIVKPEDTADFQTVLPKEEKVLEIVRAKAAAGERVLIYTSWTRTDSQKKLLGLLRSEGFRAEILDAKLAPEKREEWVSKKVAAGIQVLITNPRCVETGLDLNAFTTLIFYSMGYNLFTLRQASRRSWRINQTAPRVEVYMLYYAGTMQAKAMKLMASKLAVAGLIEGTFSEEGLAAMSDVRDMTSQMAKELMLGIRDNVEDIAAAFRKMAIINPQRGARQIPSAAQPEQKAMSPVPERRDDAICTEGVSSQQTLCVECLPQTVRGGRKPKYIELENQLSIFDTAA